ncbi:MAG TPA: hypothetical protein VGU02_11460, partial [Gaiellaceae bacterium]|nr:hypothetical protein [Gaiellaceae bacterium]
RLSAAHVASGHQITATGTVAPARSVSALVLSRFNPATSSWQKVATAPTSTHGTSRFIFVVPAGATRLEINTGRSGGSRGAYLPATSPSLVVHGVGPAPASHSAHHKR